MKKNKRAVTVVVAAVVILLLLICIPIIILLVKYHRTSYINEVPVERSDSFVMPEYPEIIEGSEGITDIEETSEFVETSIAENDNTETTAEPETIVETTAETTSRETQAPVIETAPVYTKPTQTPSSSSGTSNAATQQPTVNSNNSFGNSTNAVSVYSKNYPLYSVEQKDKNIINILVMGTDSRDVTVERGRSDTMLVVSYNKKTAEVKMVSFLRDALVPIENHDWNRLNTAYAYGGAGLAVNTINDLFGLDLQNFVVVDFNGAKEFIDKIGGVDVTLTQAEIDYYSNFINQELVVGVNHMDSQLAMAHMQNRTTDSDFGRARRQRDVVTAVMKKVTTMSITEISSLIDYAMSIVKTNISASTLVSLAVSVLADASNLSFSTQQVPYADSYQYAWYKNMAILSFDIDEAAKRVGEFIYGE